MTTRRFAMPSSRFILSAAVLLCFALGAQHTVSSAAAPRPQTLLPKLSGSPLYIIQPGDILEIDVWKEPEVSRKQVLVRPDGRIAINLAQDMQAVGLNPSQLKDKLEEQLKEYIHVPVLTVIVTAIQSYRVYVTGSVAKNGPIVSESPLTVLQALSMAGGFTQFANKREIVIIRGNGEDTRKHKFNYDEFISGENYSQNELLKSGDVIYVP